MLPVIEALTSSTRPARSATIAMISSAALPKVALRKPADRRAGAFGQVLGRLTEVWASGRMPRQAMTKTRT